MVAMQAHVLVSVNAELGLEPDVPIPGLVLVFSTLKLMRQSDNHWMVYNYISDCMVWAPRAAGFQRLENSCELL